jgi:hypothetical protein
MLRYPPYSRNESTQNNRWQIVVGKRIVILAARVAPEHGCPELPRHEHEIVLENDRLVVMEQV